MRKIKAICLFAVTALAAAAAVSGCKSREAIDLSGVHTTEAETMASSEAESSTGEAETMETDETKATESAGSNSANALSVRAETATERQGKVSIEYPVLSNLPSSSPAETINSLIKEKAIQIIADSEWETDITSTEITYELVTLDRSMAVITYSGMVMVEGAAHPYNVYYTTNVDLGTGKLMGLSDYGDPKTLAEYILSDDCEIVEPAEHKAEVKESIQGLYTLESLTEVLDKCDFTAKDLSGFPESFSYEKGGDIYVCVPITHAMGDYAIVRYSPDVK